MHIGTQIAIEACESPSTYSYGELVTAWNDRPGRTKQEVIDLVDRTLERLQGL